MANSNEKSYVFVSYAHANSDKVLPIVTTMQENGISVWYDEGIVAGSEWPEFIAEKVVNCHKFILFVSNAYLNSQNCKRELNFAISRKKNILSIYLEDVQLSPGMEMQLGTYQAIYRNRFLSDRALGESLCLEPFFDSCRTVAASSATGSQRPTQSTVNRPIYHAPNHNTQTANSPAKKNKTVAGLLAICLGTFGVHHFYLGHIFMGILYILFCWTYIPTILSVIQGLIYLFTSEEKFQDKYVKKTAR